MNKQQKAAKARTDAANARIWKTVQEARKRTGCKCKLRKGMTYDELRALNGGCTDVPNRSGGRFVCPALDTYRRLGPKAVVVEEAA